MKDALTEAGFTLIEVMIAMAILSFALVSLASMQIVAIQVNSDGNRLTRATTLVQDKIEALIALPFGHTDLGDPTATGACQSHTEPNPPAGYTLNWCVDSSADATAKMVTVTAAWQGGHDSKSQHPKSFALSFVRSIYHR
jgi:general secretion pathway protein I